VSRSAVFMALGALLLASQAHAEDPALVEAGQTLYDLHCAPCHGEGLRNPGSSFDLKLLHEDERPRFDKSVMEGKGPMPPWRGTLGPAELDRLWAYIREYAYD
jgi:mono/diheme cytochrome c family protein